MERLVAITGLSGSGKSLAVRCFEDLGYFCVDNLPVLLIPPFVELLQRTSDSMRGAAIVIDARERHFLEAFPETLRDLRGGSVPVTVLFFECSDDVLKRRFSESRRPHPLESPSGSLEEAIRRERETLAPLRDLADRIIDTSRFTAHELRAFLRGSFGDVQAGSGLNVNVVSFGFKYGLPSEADLVFDVRFLPNPYFVEDLRPLDGRAEPVRAFLEARDETTGFMDRLRALMEYLLPLYQAEGKSYLTVTIGCTGGKHRSVALAEELGGHFAEAGWNVSVAHRDLGRE